MIDASHLHGRLVRLGDAIHQPLTAHDYPEPVATLLGQCMTLTAGLASALKFDGSFSLQAKGDGPITLLVADVTNDGAMRGYAQFKDGMPPREVWENAPVPHLLGKGYLAFTVDQGPDMERYQGIVDLDGATLADCIHHYFRQSNQFTATVKLAVGKDANGNWRGGGLILQRLPDEENPIKQDDYEEAWRRAVILMSSGTDAEMLDPDLSPNDFLFRLFHEDGVRVFDTQGIRFACRCSTERMAAAVAMLTDEELEAMKIDGRVEVTCQFCNATHTFDETALQTIRNPSP